MFENTSEPGDAKNPAGPISRYLNGPRPAPAQDVTLRAEIAELIKERDEARRHNAAALEVHRAEEAALRGEIAYLEERRASLEADIIRVRQKLLSSLGKEVAAIERPNAAPPASVAPPPIFATPPFTPLEAKDDPVANAPLLGGDWPSDPPNNVLRMRKAVPRKAFWKGAVAAAFVGALIGFAAPYFTDAAEAVDVLPVVEESAVAVAPPAPGAVELAAPKPPPAAPKSILKLRILNGTGVNGLAAGIAAKLPTREFRVLETTNADRNGYKNTIIRSPNREEADRVRAALGIGVIEIKSAAGADVVVILGSDARGRAPARARAVRPAAAKTPTSEPVAEVSAPVAEVSAPVKEPAVEAPARAPEPEPLI